MGLKSMTAATALASFGIVQAQQWEAVPYITQASRNAGNTGGEGCQVIRHMAIDSTGNFLLMGTDVGGVYRSVNGGANWEPANVGIKARGGTALAIDPNNSQRCLVAGDNSSNWGNHHGLYLSTDQGATWTIVLPMTYATGNQDDLIAYDKSSLSGGSSQVAYFSAPDTLGLWKTLNGGSSWTKIQTGFSASIVKVHPVSGAVYVGNSTGLHRSVNGGSTFTTVYSGNVRGLDVLSTQPNNVYITTASQVLVSTDSGASFAPRNGAGLPATKNLYRVKVSPVDPNDMVINHDTGVWYDQPRFYTSDGGNNWAASNFDNTQSFMPFNGRSGLGLWHPTQANTVWSTGADWITKSTDGGSTYVWNNNGYNGVFASGFFNFNPQSPNTLLLTSQDYNSAVTHDQGTTWKYLQVGESWGGYNYAGYAFSSTRMFAGNSPSWGGTRSLKVSIDGGTTWSDTGLTGSGTDTACGDPNNSNIAFWHDLRTTDQGATWTRMTACKGVFTYNPAGSKELYGANLRNVVKSTDGGATWTTVATFPGNVYDIAFDHVRNRLYVASDNRVLYQWQGGTVTDITSRLPADNQGWQGANTVAVDPVNPDVVYAGKHGDIYMSDAAVVRSIDGGVTFQKLTKQPGGTGLDGARETTCIRVHPVTRYAWAAGQCFGNWKIAPPSTTPQPPAIPSGLSAVPGNTQVSLSWNSSLGATSYNLKRSTSSGGPYATIAPGITSTTYNNTGLINGTTYYYVVSALNSVGESGNSSQVIATPQAVVPPNPPSNLNATVPSQRRKINLSWTQSSSSGITQNKVYRSTSGSGGPYSLRATLSASTSYSDTGLTSGVTYFYSVTAVNASGESAFSNYSGGTAR